MKPRQIEKSGNEWGATFFAMLGIAILALLIFGKLLGADTLLFTTDANVGSFMLMQRNMPECFLAWWSRVPMFGEYYGRLPFTWSYLLLLLTPVRQFNNWIYAVDLVLASFFFLKFLRLRGCDWHAAVLGVLTAFWVGTNLTISYAGHFSKFGTLLFSAVALWCIEKSARTNRMAWSLLAGGAIGGMFLEQQDVALFLGLFWGAYAVFAFGREQGWQWGRLFKGLIPIAVVALLVAGPTAWQVYSANVEGIAAVGENSNPEEKWEFCTQWSVPPAESIDLVAPGFMGWRSGEPEGPYWGRTGRSAGWETTHNGFMNFRLESVYIGILPLIFAVYAIFTYGGSKNRRADLIFWGLATTVALLLAFGKYAPFYQLFYHLPGMSSIRNPNKFLHVFQIGLAMLAAFGAHQCAITQIPPKKLRAFAVAVVSVAGIFLMVAFGMALARSSQESHWLAAGWGEFAPVIVRNMIESLVHAGIAGLIGGGVLLLLATRLAAAPLSVKRGLLWAVGLAVAVDALLLSKHYVQVVSYRGTVGDSIVTKYLQDNQNDGRVLTLDQSGFYNNWLSVLFPYHGISAFNFTQMPRMPEDYRIFLETVGRNPVRTWELGSIQHVLAPAKYWREMEQTAGFGDRLTPVLGFDVFSSGGPHDGLTVVRRAPPTAGQLILSFTNGLPYYSLIGSWQVVTDKEACPKLASAGFKPTQETLVSMDTAEGLPASGNALVNGNIRIESSTLRKIVLRVSASNPAILLRTQKYAPEWRAEVDGRPIKLLKCNYLCQGVYLEPGEHEVVFRYDLGTAGLWAQGLGLVLCLAALAMAARPRASVA